MDMIGEGETEMEETFSNAQQSHTRPLYRFDAGLPVTELFSDSDDVSSGDEFDAIDPIAEVGVRRTYGSPSCGESRGFFLVKLNKDDINVKL
ncbi:hypothetical protein SARC_13021 [Sphaeroforma arctica JP610]|uniref:Uncharacterized protein n=1 Tax=Sphaeroforma arctica JP610 TaxID=667725 RepID=A0A0L0FD74_9EUKA|nr:hypothetical protein SARC_13021 [Sphaeroforma arctica JP610]KNC74431.1 hypothetical protein SARC_13021 [Sphaeroforma arctica JP610]|eukprot:XP_014148333.1 hypothetical protein SARC_13021 [Sphaeroforma arctica JP610]